MNEKFKYFIEIIDKAAQKDLLYHYNGGQAYIRWNHNSNLLIVIDHTNADNPTREISDGTKYFQHYAGNQFHYSKVIRENPLMDFFIKTGAIK